MRTLQGSTFSLLIDNGKEKEEAGCVAGEWMRPIIKLNRKWVYPTGIRWSGNTVAFCCVLHRRDKSADLLLRKSL
ncbi:hypothetical protein TNCT_705761 [Trichonephila clavata]|uniref:Uncharacterized protein n=1 Tax=Trichonephila clavata TaxID=2740835 RepID=A0A8X6H5K4_TRICU|nr:hypothetical protein TNCT_705761 [Trichonephila clavata]